MRGGPFCGATVGQKLVMSGGGFHGLGRGKNIRGLREWQVRGGHHLAGGAYCGGHAQGTALLESNRSGA
jgi:hypothetical protein